MRNKQKLLRLLKLRGLTNLPAIESWPTKDRGSYVGSLAYRQAVERDCMGLPCNSLSYDC